MTRTIELDPEVRAYLQTLPAVAPWWETHDVLLQRIGYRVRARAYAPGPAMRTEDLEIRGGAGHRIPIRIYRPDTLKPAAPAVLYLHGGGWSVGDLEFTDAHIRRVAQGTGALVASVDYRLAPDHPYPAGMDDCWAALTWFAEAAADLGADPTRLAVCGDSAGATNAAALSLLARNFGGPQLRAQCLWYPGFLIQPEVASMTQPWREITLPAAAVRAYRHLYAGTIPEPLPATLAATQAADLSGMPPTIVVAAGFDPLFDEPGVYADRLREAGGAVELQVFDSLPHGFCAMAGAVASVTSAVEQTVASFAALLG
jgi:acetyl esterase/lipase